MNCQSEEEKTMPNINKGNRVEYIGTLQPSATGKRGVVTSISRRGINVRLDGETLTRLCFEVSLKKISRREERLEKRDILLQKYAS